MSEFRMPSLGADMEAGRLVKWLVQPGDRVQRGDIIAVVDTDKAEVDVEVWDSGTVTELVVPEGEKVPVGTVLAHIGDAEGVVAARPPAPEPPSASRASAAAPSPPTRPVAAPPAARTAEAGSAGRVRASPYARRIARELGVDLTRVTGTGPSGAIVEADVARAAGEVTEERAEPVPSMERTAAMRRAIALAMGRSNAEIPHYYVGGPIDMRRATQWLDAENRHRPARERVVYSALLLRAVALAAREVPEMNGFWRDGEFEASSAVHVGVAIALPGGGLVVPAIHDADGGSVRELMGRLLDLVRRARAGSLRGSELTDATITVTSLGERTADAVYGLIYPPQVALVGFGALVERPWAEDGALSVRPQVYATVAADHRASDGRVGARFLRRIDQFLQAPDRL